MKFPLILAAFIAMPLGAQTNVQQFQPGITPEGITYFLPKTSIRFVITAKRTTYNPGPYAEYASRYFNNENVPLTPYDEWQLEDIKTRIYGTPDTTEAYSIALNPKSAAPLVTLTPDGILLAVNDEVDFPEPLPHSSVTPIPTPTVSANDFLTPDIIRAVNVPKKAQLTAEEIYDIRENRDLIAKGQADFNPTDGTQLSLMLQRLDEAEKGLMSLFAGTSSAERHTFIIDFTPEATCLDYPLFRFSRHLGLVDIDDLAGELYTLTLRNETTLAGAPGNAPVPKAKKELDDLRYRIPGRGRILLNTPESCVLEMTTPIAQFGRTEHLGSELFNKKFTTKVQLNSTTGNIERISIPNPTK